MRHESVCRRWLSKKLTFRPLFEDNLRDFARWVRRAEEKFFRFAADENQAQIYLHAEEKERKKNH